MITISGQLDVQSVSQKDKSAQQPAHQSAQQPAHQSAQQPAHQSAQQPVHQSTQQPAHQSVQQPAQQPVQQPAYPTKQSRPMHRFLNYFLLLLSAAGAACYFLPLCRLSLYESFPSDGVFSVSLWRMTSGIEIYGLETHKSICILFLVLPLCAMAASLLSHRLHSGIGYAVVMVAAGLEATLLVYVRRLIETLVQGYRFYVYFEIGWYLYLCLSLLTAVLAVVCQFSAALTESRSLSGDPKDAE